MTTPAPTVTLSSWTMAQEMSPIDDLAEMVRMIRENSGKPPEPRYLDPHLRGIVCRFAYEDSEGARRAVGTKKPTSRRAPSDALAGCRKES
jgi:hypothetical protein